MLSFFGSVDNKGRFHKKLFKFLILRKNTKKQILQHTFTHSIFSRWINWNEWANWSAIYPSFGGYGAKPQGPWSCILGTRRSWTGTGTTPTPPSFASGTSTRGKRRSGQVVVHPSRGKPFQAPTRDIPTNVRKVVDQFSLVTYPQIISVFYQNFKYIFLNSKI